MPSFPNSFFSSEESKASRGSRAKQPSVVDPVSSEMPPTNIPIEQQAQVVLPEERFTETSLSPVSQPSPSFAGSVRDASDFSIGEISVSVKNATKLFSFVTKRNWAGAVKRCNTVDGKKEAATWIVEKNKDGTVRWKLLPIHQACENKAPSEVIKALIAANPDSLMTKDSGGDLPLHLACRERASKAVIAALLSNEPEASKIKDDEGRTPLHLACRQGVAVQIVDSLIVCYYRASRTPDAYHLLPIHWACAQNASVAIIESLLRANPDSSDHKDKWGRTPISLAMASTNPDKAKVLEALNRDPSFWATNLSEEIDVLKKKLDTTTSNEKNYSGQLEELEKQNAELRAVVHKLTHTNKYTDDDISKLSEENREILSDVNGLKKKLNEFTFIFRGMEEQRKELLKVVNAMEESLQQAVDVAGDDYLNWRVPEDKDPFKREESGKTFQHEDSDSTFNALWKV